MPKFRKSTGPTSPIRGRGERLPFWRRPTKSAGLGKQLLRGYQRDRTATHRSQRRSGFLDRFGASIRGSPAGRGRSQCHAPPWLDQGGASLPNRPISILRHKTGFSTDWFGSLEAGTDRYVYLQLRGSSGTGQLIQRGDNPSVVLLRRAGHGGR